MIITDQHLDRLAEKEVMLDQWEFIQDDRKLCEYRGFSINLMDYDDIILGISFNNETHCFSKMTVGDVEDIPELNDLHDTEAYIQYAKSLIDYMIGPAPNQLLLIA